MKRDKVVVLGKVNNTQRKKIEAFLETDVEVVKSQEPLIVMNEKLRAEIIKLNEIHLKNTIKIKRLESILDASIAKKIVFKGEESLVKSERVLDRIKRLEAGEADIKSFSIDELDKLVNARMVNG